MNCRNFLKTTNVLLIGALLLYCTGCGGYGGGGTGGGGAAPSAPTGLVATPGNATVSLTWTASTGATGYYIKRSTTSGAETQIAAQAGTSYNDTTVTNGTKYFYVVAAYNSYGTSADSAEVSATPTAPAAVNVTITVDPTKTRAISPYIYGTNFYEGNTNAPALLTLDRAGWKSLDGVQLDQQWLERG